MSDAFPASKPIAKENRETDQIVRKSMAMSSLLRNVLPADVVSNDRDNDRDGKTR